ncbi:cytochrome b/b6 domain-containing protein [Roseateles chitinivorans]|uniref:cytochrome b/b6 domain-containing protein n=1 Tax=Roseateles chitinivorans TaxID=2917965 RepID=UPI003D66C7CB
MDTSIPDPHAALRREPELEPEAEPVRRRLVPRHSATVRLTHWLNLLCFLTLLASGLQILNAHPRFYVGKAGADHDVAVLTLPAMPGWATLPSYHDLGAGRRIHFTFAWLLVLNGLVYLGHGVWRAHFRRDLLPAGGELDRRHLWQEIKDHARFRFPKGEAARHYNVLQKLTYLVVIFGLLPLMLATGLAMSPGVNAAAPWLPDVLGGRATARTLHFLTAFSLVAFVVVHLVMVVASGTWNNLRSMVTGRYAIETGPAPWPGTRPDPETTIERSAQP